jgi:hypothetical protein
MSNIPEEKEKPIDRPRILLCEGLGDAQFLKHLIEERQIGDFYITYPNQINSTDPAGRDGFTRRLRALKLVRGYEAVTDLVVVSDNDDDPKAKFQRVCELIEAAKGFQVPTEPAQMTRGTPRVGVFMLPQADENGQLETLCLQSCIQQWPEAADCVNQFVTCNPHIAAWEQGKQEKMKMRCLISSICAVDPYTSIPHLWSRPGYDLVPLGHACFTPLADFLRTVAPKEVELPLAPA